MNISEQEAIRLLAETYGLELVLSQNDISEEFVLSFLLQEGLIDLEDYFFEDVDTKGEE